MRKRILGIMLIMVIFAAFIPCIYAAEIVANGECSATGSHVTWTLDSDGVLTISGNGEMLDYYPDGDPDPGFIATPWNKGDVTKIIIEDGITSIGSGAFAVCENLKNIDMSDSVTSIRESSFERCANITNITLPAGLTDIGNYAFCDCTALAEINIPDTVVNIGVRAFGGCDLITSVVIPAGVQNIGLFAFNSSAITDIDVVPENNSYCSVDGVLFDKDKTSIIVYPRAKTDTSYIIPGTVTSISNYAFSNSILESIIIPNSVTTIGGGAFEYCADLLSLALPDGLTNISYNMLSGCIGLTSITVPKGVTTISEDFDKCTNLAEINVDAENENFSSIDGVLFNKDQTTLIRYPIAKADTSYTIPKGVTSLTVNSFYGSKNLVRVSIATGITEIKNMSFANCSALEDVIIPYTVQSFTSWSFSSCDSLKTAYFVGPYEKVRDLYTYAWKHKTFGGLPSFYSPGINSVTPVISDSSGYSFRVNLSGAPLYTSLITALYNDGIMTGMGITEITDVTPESLDDCNVIVTVNAETADTAKIFLWDSMSGMYPLCEAKELNINYVAP